MLINTDLDTSSFSVFRLPRVVFGAGSISFLAGEIKGFGFSALIVTGRSFANSDRWPPLQKRLRDAGLVWEVEQVSGEPRAALVDQVVAKHAGKAHDVVVGIGGGSVLDTAKAVAGLLPLRSSVMNYLEGVGQGHPYQGMPLPFIAVPTTAGTGSEMTKNAVLSGNANRPFKKSFRDERLTARVALIDPQLLASCPQNVKASNAMDAFTQLLESYVALGASPKSDVVAVKGIKEFLTGFSFAQEADLKGDDHLAYASMMSGISLAQAGLGVVHGLASPLGGHFPIPHGVACGTLLAVATEVNIRALSQRQPDSPALDKYARVGNLISGFTLTDPERSRHALQETLWRWTGLLGVARLGDYGVKSSDIPLIVDECRGGSMKTNPLALSDAELEEILCRRL